MDVVPLLMGGSVVFFFLQHFLERGKNKLLRGLLCSTWYCMIDFVFVFLILDLVYRDTKTQTEFLTCSFNKIISHSNLYILVGTTTSSLYSFDLIRMSQSSV